jgi:ketosteroid isomerase-like protein
MPASKAEVVRELYRRFQEGDREGALDLLSDDFLAEVPASMSAEPDVYRGREGALRYLRGFEGAIDNVRFVPHEFLEEGGCVLAVLDMRGQGAGSGIEVVLEAVVVHCVESGKITRMHPFQDLGSARAALAADEFSAGT